MSAPKLELSVTTTTKKSWHLDTVQLTDIICQWFADHVGEDVKPTDIEFGPGGNYHAPTCLVQVTEVEQK